MAKEIERKFLLSEFPRCLQAEGEESLQQGYLHLDDSKDLRIRKSPKGCTLTAKYGVGMVREEKEQAITDVLFNTLWPFTEKRRITKTRFRAQHRGHTCEIDVYHGELKGLVVMETEFATEADAKTYTVPEFCETEITGDHRYRNAELAQFGLPED